MFTFDTNAVIYYLKGEVSIAELLESMVRAYVPIFIATVTEVELLSLPTPTAIKNERIEAILPLFSIVQLDSKVARKAGELRRFHKKLKLADSVIAATALAMHSTLATRNVKDFKKISGLMIQKV